MSNENMDRSPPQQAPRGLIYRRASKSMLIAYLLALLGGAGCLGLHRFYLGYKRTALTMLVLTLGAILLPMIGIYSVTLTWWVVTLWVLVDLFLIPKMTRDRNAEIAAEIDRELANRN
ncbi:TM2 domain-containing membrane protein YozV [Neorhizobium huautlense]|uniref:TM2 domain-containing membrane protein YozV n=1 Tax=Neorhizobium huautlense TaxID=67774 RepID=A0ABT9PWN0_9HYPH|nr:NINE protein [Neorhizobium huautlense]MDP9838149.1 TM2 domain-containing membrane protein YozV [Neorhizobium huautlense]